MENISQIHNTIHDETKPMNTSETLMLMAKNWKPKQKNKRGKKSKLDQYLDVIRYMRSARHLSYKDIHAFVLDSGTKIGYQGFVNFVNNNMRSKISKLKNK